MASIDLAMKFSSSDPLGQLDELRKMIQKQPQRSDLRVFLFQVYCVQGEWVKAATQLDVLLELDPSTKPMVETYREALRCEVLRREVFEGKRSPLVLGSPGDWLAGMLEALRQGAQQLAQAAQESQDGKQAGGRDPLGRGNSPLGNSGVKIPGPDEIARAREILQELRRRAAEMNRPQQERDYLDRLLKAF